jgi:hypothetical protein
VKADSFSTIMITTDASTPLGVYNLPVQGSATFRSGDTNMTVVRKVNLKLTVTDHPVSSVTPSRARAGTVVTIKGSGFGADPGPANRGTAANHVEWAGVTLSTTNVLSWNDTQITFLPPDDPALFDTPVNPQKFPLIGSVVVVARGTDSNDDFTFQIENYIDSITTATGSGSITVTLTGTSFGKDPGYLFRGTEYEHITLSGNPLPYTSIKLWSNKSIVFVVPWSTLSGMVSVTANGFESNQVLLNIVSAGGRVYLPVIKK